MNPVYILDADMCCLARIIPRPDYTSAAAGTGLKENPGSVMAVSLYLNTWHAIVPKGGSYNFWEPYAGNHKELYLMASLYGD